MPQQLLCIHRERLSVDEKKSEVLSILSGMCDPFVPFKPDLTYFFCSHHDSNLVELDCKVVCLFITLFDWSSM